MALIPLAERLSFVTEEVACHTNQTIGALLNATFGNAPELLISAAALQEGFYRVVQLALLGSMLTNLLFVFGLSCLVGGLRYQVQEVRIVSGNASIGMLALAVAGLALPAVLTLSDEMISRGEEKEYVDKNGDGVSDINDGPSASMTWFSRFNAIIMILGYLLYLLFQLGSHRGEFEDMEEESEGESAAASGNGTYVGSDEEGQALQRHASPTNSALRTRTKTQRNTFCLRLFSGCRAGADNIERTGEGIYQRVRGLAFGQDIESFSGTSQENDRPESIQENQSYPNASRQNDLSVEMNVLPQSQPELRQVNRARNSGDGDGFCRSRGGQHSDISQADQFSGEEQINTEQTNSTKRVTSNKSHCSDEPEEESYITTIDVLGDAEGAQESKSKVVWHSPYGIQVTVWCLFSHGVFFPLGQDICLFGRGYFGCSSLRSASLPW